MEDFYKFDDDYRDHISTVDAAGKRLWIYPKKPKGYYHNLRALVAVILLGLLFAGPFIQVDGHPFMLFNVFDRKFIIFGVPFWPQDFHLIVLALITFFIFIVMFTVIYGRVWCGWACPQTIFMEMVFRKIEYWIEGDAGKQRKLQKQPWNTDKILKKGIKHIVFFSFALIISHLVMAYLIGVDETIKIISQSPLNNLAGFSGLMFFTFLFYFVFAYLREQACIAICPYGRLQGVFLGKNSIAVMYDWLRGEPRGRLKKKQDDLKKEKGDCIDCKMCVHVCPTGIDIRNGTQLECVNCTACMDACDDVMTKIKKPKGLIRLASYNSIEKGIKNLFNARVIGYSVVLIILITFQVYLFSTRIPVEATILRVPGMLYQEQDGNRISNLYNIQFVNKTYEDMNLTLKIQGNESATIKKVGDETISIPANGNLEGVYFIEFSKDDIKSTKTSLVVEIYDQDKLIDEVKTNFLGPQKRSAK